MKNNMTYTERNGILYPDLTLPETKQHSIGKYGQMRLEYLKKHRRGTYTTLLTECRLNEHLHQIDTEAHERVAELIEAFKTSRNITEELKSNDPLRWVQEMNDAKASAEEIVFKELIYV